MRDGALAVLLVDVLDGHQSTFAKAGSTRLKYHIADDEQDESDRQRDERGHPVRALAVVDGGCGTP